MMDSSLPKVDEIVELSVIGNPQVEVLKFEVISVDAQTGLMEARACQANADGEHCLIRTLLGRLQ